MSRIINKQDTMGNIVEKIGNRIVSHTQWYDDYWSGVQKFWHLNQFNLEVINLGSNSAKYAFSYDRLGVAGKNWSIGPQSLVHDFNVLKNYFSYLKEKAIVIIVLVPFSSLDLRYTKKSNLKYYTFLHPATIIGFEEVERQKALRIKNSPVKEMPLLCVKRTLKECIRLVIRKKVSKCDFEHDAHDFISMWKRRTGIEDFDAELSDRCCEEQEKRSKVLSEMIDFCIERNLRPVIVIPPMHPSLASKFSMKFRDNYIYSFVTGANRAGVPFLDYMDDKRFADDRYFRNSFFMSNEGAELFTKTVLEELEVI